MTTDLPEKAVRVVAVGAYERDNFGDLLYLEFMRAHAGEGLAIQLAAPIKSESSEPFGRTVPAAALLLAQGEPDPVSRTPELRR